MKSALSYIINVIINNMNFCVQIIHCYLTECENVHAYMAHNISQPTRQVQQLMKDKQQSRVKILRINNSRKYNIHDIMIVKYEKNDRVTQIQYILKVSFSN